MRQTSGKKTIPIIFALLLIMGTFVVVAPNMVNAAQEGDYTYTVINGNATITGYTGIGGAITIPSTLGGFATQIIGSQSFENCTNITSVTIPNSVIEIGSYAFDNCTILNSVTIPNTVALIGVWAFHNCTSLISITIPNQITTIEFSLFSHCTSLISVTIPNSVTIIQDSAFRECTSLVSITLPESLTYIGDAVFDYCTSLSSMIIPSNVNFVGTEAFAYCSSLTSVTVLGNVNDFENHSFFNCRSLVSLSFYGLVAPTILGQGWVNGTPPELRGHAYAASDFPPPGSDFHGLIMGAIIPVVPGVPTSFSANPGNGYVLLTWSPPADNGGAVIFEYKVYRSSTETGSYSLIGSPTTLSLNDTGLTNGQIHWYKVSAVNAIGEGAMTVPISSTSYTVPNVPTGLTAVAGSAKITLNWTAPSFNGGRAIDYYVIYQDSVALASHPTGLSTVINGLTNGQTYSFAIAAHNLAGLSARSGAISVAPFNLPDAPTGLTGIDGDSNVTLNWTAPAFNGGEVITNYVIYQDGVALTDNITGLTTVITGLTNGQTYTFAVAANTSVGTGAQSNVVSSTPFRVPDAPTGLTAVPGSAKVTLNWTAPAFDGGRAIDYYVVYQEGVALPDNITGLSTVITGLTNDVTYNFTVAAHNLAGLSNQSNSVSSRPLMIPDAPTGLTGIDGNSNVTLNWTAPAFNGGEAIDYYVVYQDGVALDDNQTNVTTVITGLTNGQTYTFSVAAHNSVGIGAQSNLISSTPYTVPDAPTGLSGVAGSNQVTLNWTAPAFDGGRAIDYYVVYQEGVALPDNITGLVTVIAGLTNGVTYNFTVAAHNLAGLGAQSNTNTSTPFSSVPGAPTGLMAIAGSSAKIALNWTAPVVNGGLTIDYYVVYQDGVALLGHPTGLSTVITGLTNGVTYSFTVAAHNLLGLSAQSIAVSSKAYGMPDAPTGLAAAAGNTNVTLNWTAPASDGGSAIDYYVVYQDGIALFDHPTGLTMVVSGLTNGVSHSFTVAAHNLAGLSNQSSAVSASSSNVPNAPTLTSIVAGYASVTITWTAPANNGGSAITGYKLYWDIANPPVAHQALYAASIHTVEVTGLTPGTVYYVSVTAINSAGESAKPAALNATPYTLPNAPIVTGEIVDGSHVKLTWTANGTGGSPITGYKVYRWDGTNYTLIASTSASALTYTDSDLTSGQTYLYKVSAVNAAGVGGMSIAVSLTPNNNTMDLTWILIAVILIILVLVVVLFIWRRRKNQL